MSFLTPLFLIGLAAIAIPVLAHLVRKSQAKTVLFSSLMFLQATTREQVRRRRLRDLLLMLLRVAILALLALAFARPFFAGEELPFIRQAERRSTVLVIDRSYSMQYGDWFERARTAALERIDEAGADDELAIVAFSDEAEQLTRLGDDPSVHRNVVETLLQPTNRPTDLYRALRLAEEILDDAQNEDRSIVLISDFQQNAWGGAFENWKLDEEVALVPVKVADDEVDNRFVQDFEAIPRRAGEEVAVRYNARVNAAGASVTDPGEALLNLDGAELHSESLPERPSARLSTQHLAPREGILQGELTLSDDAMTVDNQYFFTLTVGARPQLLGIDGGPRGTFSDALFLRNAFNLGDEALYRFSTGGLGRLTRTELRDVQVLFLSNVNTLTADQIETVRQYAEDGGTVVLSFGNQTDTAVFSVVLERLGVGRLERIVNTRSDQGIEAIIGEVDLKHPIFALFAESGTGSIFRPQFRRYVRVAADSGASVIGRFDSGDPFLIEKRQGRGRVLVYTSTFGTQWTDFALNELYVPFLYQLVGYGVEGAARPRMFTVGDVVLLDGRPGETWEISAPQNRVYRVAIEDDGTGVFRETEAAGQYLAARGSERFAFSVNVDARESDLRTRDQEEAYAAVVQPSTEVARSPQEATTVSAQDDEERQKLWRYLILLLLVLFGLETVLANRRKATMDSNRQT